MRRTTTLLSLAALALAAAAPAKAAAPEWPARKAGQWEIKMNLGPGMPAMASQMCIDDATDRQLMQSGFAAGTCSKMDMAHTGEGYVIDSVCQHGPMTTTTHAVMTGDFQSSYKVVISSDIAGGPPQMPAHSEITQEATWTGACTGGMTPGDVQTQGMKINVLKMMGGG